jgi:hypothetical protein
MSELSTLLSEEIDMPIENLVCPSCGKVFSAPHWQKLVFCSRGCSAKARTVPVQERFRSYVGVTTSAGCILWTGCINKNGYGIISDRTASGRNILAHRLAWEIENGPIPDGLLILHECDNTICINIAHMRIGTHKENSEDSVSRNRQARGERSGVAVLTEAIVRAIRARHAEGGVSQGQIAREFGTIQQQVSRIINRVIWKHI